MQIRKLTSLILIFQLLAVHIPINHSIGISNAYAEEVSNQKDVLIKHSISFHLQKSPIMCCGIHFRVSIRWYLFSPIPLDQYLIFFGKALRE